MGRPSIDQDKEYFLETLQSFGGSAGNVSLQGELAWESDRYWRTHGLLADDGQIIRGRGKGGSVSLVSRVAQAPISTTVVRAKELDLYDPAKETLEKSWVKERSFDDFIVEVTGLPGRKNTGGTWTRPDISLLASKAFPYLPHRIFEIVTFEVKTTEAVDVIGAFEALSHAQFATLSYVIFCTNGADFESEFSDTHRILALANQHGVGVIVAGDVSQYSTWDEKIRPRRNIPDPEQSNLFISTCFSESAKNRVITWQK